MSATFVNLKFFTADNRRAHSPDVDTRRLKSEGSSLNLSVIRRLKMTSALAR